MINLRLYTYDQWGNEIATPWSFTPLLDEDSYDVYRDTTQSADNTPRRRPYAERERRDITLPAGLLRSTPDWQNFRRMLRAHKIMWLRQTGNASRPQTQWIEYALDQAENIAFERVQEVTKLRRIKITLVQVDAIDFTEFEQTSAQLADELGPANNS